MAVIIIYWNTLRLGDAVFARRQAGLAAAIDNGLGLAQAGWGVDDGEVDASVRQVDDELPVVDIVEGSAEACEDVAGVVLEGGP